MSLKNHQYSKILREYDRKQFESRHELDARKKAVYANIPELQEIDDAIVSNSIQTAKYMVMGNDMQLEQLKQQNEQLSYQKIELLVEHGYPDNYLEPRYVCSDCHDTGYIGTEKCHCFKQAIVDLVYDQSNIKNVLEEQNFSTYNLSYYSDTYIDPETNRTALQNAKRVYQIARQFIDEFEVSYANILLYGNTGVGKTFLANCIAKELLDCGHTIIYLTSFQLFSILEKQAFSKNEDGYEAENQLSYILDCDLLIIDDLGTELSNSFTNTKLFLVINERHLRSKATIISTNLPIESIKSTYSERIYSRITSDYWCLKVFGEDIRLKKKFY